MCEGGENFHHSHHRIVRLDGSGDENIAVSGSAFEDESPTAPPLDSKEDMARAAKSYTQPNGVPMKSKQLSGEKYVGSDEVNSIAGAILLPVIPHRTIYHRLEPFLAIQW